jgi:hypothetical protein
MRFMATGACAWTTFVTLGVSSSLTRVAEGVPAPAPVARDDAEATADLGGCHEPGVVYVEPHSSGQPFDVEIIGLSGHIYVTITPGMSPAAIVEAVNVGTSWTRVRAELSPNPARVAVRSKGVGTNHYVIVRQSATMPPVIYARPFGGEALHERTDYGCAFGIPACAEPAVVYVETGEQYLTNGLGHTTMFFTSNGGLQPFTFASGMWQDTILGYISEFGINIGMEGEQCVANPDRIELRSRLLHETGFVSVQQVGGTPPIVYGSPVGSTPSYDVTAYGLSAMPGDADCNRVIDVDDLIRVLMQWGDCLDAQPSCPADLTGDGEVAADDLVQVILRWSEE